LIIMNSITPNQNNKYSHKNHKISTKAWLICVLIVKFI
jgi:hypothetical protein